MNLQWKTIIICYLMLGLYTTGSVSIRVSNCLDNEQSPSLTIECPGMTIKLTKVICVKLSKCADYTPALDDLCTGSDTTVEWKAICEWTNPCTISASCSPSVACPQFNSYIYAEYECISEGATLKAVDVSLEVPTLASATKHTFRQNSAIFIRANTRRCLLHHVINVHHHVTFLDCTSLCSMLDGCVSFNVRVHEGLCEFNNRVMNDIDITETDLVFIDGCEHYQNQ